MIAKNVSQTFQISFHNHGAKKKKKRDKLRQNLSTRKNAGETSRRENYVS